MWARLSDEELVATALQGYLAAFDELVRRFRPAVRLTVRRYADDREAVEDLCQEAFLRAFKALPHLEQSERFGAWLHAIARNLALRHCQNGARHRERCSALDQILLQGLEAQEPSPAELFDQSETHGVVRRAVETLPAPYRDVVYMHYWEGMPLPRVAAYLGAPLTTIKWRLQHAREQLRRKLEPPIGAMTGGEDQ